MTQTLEADSDGVCERIVMAVATLENTEPVELPPLFEAVDPDALTAAFETTESGAERTGRIAFPYAGYDVTVEFGDEPVVTVE
ncbi:HalOD1 output domain-containing protein [Natronobacterium gregoryi]|uniref:Halobacterial output domain-containing protein n=2 Tax=Natronobacterium gregoryi TaxID=44930 RepID=L0AMV4_NATGS|nr:HalOD1 output domain-containing protein [Natronobacterium gregoryi]AFZ74799.1 hypothetical protein Natgr_3692 [Natronobacterium gregoryi SP2]ELY66130.1 hypothetical protein C490_13239 [Natronobacterium gregoryi SP2]PLK19495.1 hypothetical protein CYV19_14655 [Natronobacterium gregoryi SP2]SFJ43367.1 hypothetical protein SAMN05443661_12916 [Natronobacterium gregoryi]